MNKMDNSKINQLIEKINKTIGESSYASEYGIPLLDGVVLDKVRDDIRQWVNGWLESLKSDGIS
jgi:hypothetical protein